MRSRRFSMTACMFLATSLVTGIARAEPLRWELSLADAEKQALSRSDRVKAAEADFGAARERATAQHSFLLPRLTLDATARYISVVGSIKPFPTSPVIPFGDNWSYSVGPAITWTALDFGANSDAWKSSKALESARGADLKLARNQVQLQLRNAYFRVQLALESQRLVADSLKLAQAQYRDILNRAKAGASSRIDQISAHREVLNLDLQFRQTQSELAAGLRDLLALVEPGTKRELTAPYDARIERHLPDGVSPASVFIHLDPLEKAISALGASGARDSRVSDAHPQLQALSGQAEASRLSAESVEAGLWPRLVVGARTSLDYPNGPVLEQIHQNTVTAALSMPLFEFGKTRSEAAERRSQEFATERRRDQARVDLKRDWARARDLLVGYEEQLKVNRQAVQETEELSRLIYTSYQAGRSNFLDVQSANLRALEAKVGLARTQVQILLQLALLASLGSES